MKLWLAWTGMALIAGCGHGLTAWSNPVVTPSGARGWTVACHRADLCYQLAGRDCPGGYRIVDGSAADEASANYLSINGSVTAHARSGKVTTLLIECRDPRRTMPTPSAVVLAPPSAPVSEPSAPVGGEPIVTKAPF